MESKEKELGTYDKALAWLAEKNQGFENFMTDHANVRFSMFIIIIVFHALLIIGYIIAQWTPDWSAIDGYNIVDNWISDLGGSPYTPLPILYDVAAFLAGLLTIPLTYFLEKQVAPPPTTIKDLKNISRWRYRFSTMGFTIGLIGNICYMGVGIFSEDRNFWGMHGITSSLAFGGFVIMGLCFGLCILLYDDISIPKGYGWFMVIIPPLTLILFGLSSFGLIGPSVPFWEWMLLFSILGWVDPLGVRMLRLFKKERELRVAGIAYYVKKGQRKKRR